MSMALGLQGFALDCSGGSQLHQGRAEDKLGNILCVVIRRHKRHFLYDIHLFTRCLGRCSETECSTAMSRFTHSAILIHRLRSLVYAASRHELLHLLFFFNSIFGIEKIPLHRFPHIFLVCRVGNSILCIPQWTRVTHCVGIRSYCVCGIEHVEWALFHYFRGLSIT